MAQVSIQELRIAPVTAFNTAHTNAATAAWTTSNATVSKLRVVSVGKDSLVQAGIPDETLQTRLRGAPAPFPGLRTGSLKVTTYLGGGSTTTTADPYATLAARVMGSIVSPQTQKWFYVGSGSNTTNIVCNAAGDCNLQNGMAFLVGGEVRIAMNVCPTYIVPNMALSAAPSAATNVSVSHSVYFDEAATQYYLDWLAIGKSTADQRQGLGSQTGLKFSGLAPGEAPKMELDLQVGDWQWCPADGRATIVNATPSGNDPPTGHSYGALYVADTGTAVLPPAARVAMRGGAFALDTGISWSPLADPSKPNAVGGWLRNPSRPTFEMTVAYDEDMPGLKDDAINKTPKQVLLQLGSVAGKCVAFWMPRFFLDGVPTEATLNNEAGLKIGGHSDDGINTYSDELRASSLSIHWF